MSITLIRHGKPDIDFNQWLTPKEFGAWVTAYDKANVNELPPKKSYPLLAKGEYVVCSNLLRATCSAALLGLNVEETNTLFREVEMPSHSANWLKLPLDTWLVFFRVAWLLGYSNKVESAECAKARAVEAADYLIKLEREYGDVVLIGHGLFNRYIIKRLSSIGYKASSTLPQRYWQAQTLFRQHSTY